MKRIYCKLAVFLPIILAGCQSGEEKQAATSPVKVKVMTVVSSEQQMSGHFSGTVEEASSTPLSFSIMGTVESVYMKLGEHVSAGQLLATIDATSMQSTYDAAEASLVQAEDAYRRMKELHDKGSLPEIKWIEVLSKVRQARSMEQVAKKNLEDCKLYAPFSGMISEKNVEVGQNVVSGVSIGKLVGLEGLKVKISVPETEISDISIGQEAIVEVPALGGSAFKGTVAEKGVVANPLSRSYDVKIRIKDSSRGLMPGMVTEVTLGGKSSGSIVIPAQIVQLDETNRTFVWLRREGKACRRTVVCGDHTAEGIRIVSGLQEGDEVIVEGQQKVCENTEVCL